MLKDILLKKAVSSILQRSEKQQDPEKLVGTFVDMGILPQLKSLNNQIIYGRRGTGKTHIIKVLTSQLKEEPHNIVVYIDARTLGSTSQFSDTSISLKQRCTSLFNDILLEISHTLLEHIVKEPPTKAEEAFDALAKLNKIIAEPVTRFTANSVVSRETSKSSGSFNSDISIGLKPALLNTTIKGEQSRASEEEKTTSYSLNQEEKVIFPDLVYSIRDLLQKAEATLYILFDEWSSLPLDIQPYLAEFLKKGFLPVSEVVVKIASLEYRSNFGIRQAPLGILGFELGSDISVAIDIDDYYVHERNPSAITDTFSNMLYKHVNSEVENDYLSSKYKINSGLEMASILFTNRNTFEELVRACEGVARDLINIFTLAYFHAERRGRDSIDKKAILETARQWFEQDKARNLDEKLQSFLERIVTEVIGNRRSRSFLLPRSLEKNEIIQRLFDARVLHLVQRGYADKENPGFRYNIYTVDYGTYVDVINTSKKPDLDIPEIKELLGDDTVPTDDKRSIRKNILTEDFLK